jgi:hypothetical protein
MKEKNLIVPGKNVLRIFEIWKKIQGYYSVMGNNHLPNQCKCGLMKYGYLVGPWLFGLHFYTLEFLCSDNCVKCGTFRKQRHINSSAHIDQLQAWCFGMNVWPAGT